MSGRAVAKSFMLIHSRWQHLQKKIAEKNTGTFTDGMEVEEHKFLWLEQFTHLGHHEGKTQIQLYVYIVLD